MFCVGSTYTGLVLVMKLMLNCHGEGTVGVNKKGCEALSTEILCVYMYMYSVIFVSVQGTIIIAFNRIEPPKGKSMDICTYQSS